MKKKTKITSILLILFLFIMMTVYLVLGFYYRDKFPSNTWVNDFYVTGMTLEEVNARLLNQYADTRLILVKKDNTMEFIPYEDIAYQVSFRDALVKLQESRNSFLWGLNIFGKSSYVLLPQQTYDEEKLMQILAELPLMAENEEQNDYRVELLKTEEGYVLFDNTRDVLNTERVETAVKEALREGKTVLKLKESGCYQDLPCTEQMQKAYDEWEKVSAFQDCKIIYEFGEDREKVGASVVCEWILCDTDGDFVWDEQGNLILDEEKVAEYVRSLAVKYDTLGGTREFTSTRGDVVTIEGGTYGNQLNQSEEVKYLVEAFAAKREETRVPEYTKVAWEQGRNDIGNTYIEVDMGTQNLYYYVDGEVVLETPIVTGNTSRKMGTPERVCFVYAKQKNRILKGRDYASHVNFWMPVNGNIGLHDAKWRKEFGGEIYKTNGSHGCINIPYDAMAELYEMVEIGTPVIMFY